MTNEQIVQRVEQIVLPVAQQAGLTLVDVDFLKEGGHWYLRIFIDKPEGISHDDCRYVSESIDELLDEKITVAHSYILEVSSPGIERPLKKLADFERFAGNDVVITTFASVNGRKKFCGCLKGVRAGDVLVEIDGIEEIFALKQIASARLAVKF